jgi:hypothetical protein
MLKNVCFCVVCKRVLFTCWCANFRFISFPCSLKWVDAVYLAVDVVIGNVTGYVCSLMVSFSDFVWEVRA